jgi:hypothetical protein
MNRSSWMSDAGFESGVSAEQRAVPTPVFTDKPLPLEVRLRHAVIGLAALVAVALLLAAIGYFAWSYVRPVTFDTMFFPGSGGFQRPETFAGFLWVGASAVLYVAAAVILAVLGAGVLYLLGCAFFEMLANLGRYEPHLRRLVQSRRAGEREAVRE